MKKHADHGECSARLHVTIADGQVQQMIHCGQMVHTDESRSSFLRLTISHAGSEWKVHSYRPQEGGFVLAPDPWLPPRELTRSARRRSRLAESHDAYTGPRYKRRIASWSPVLLAGAIAPPAPRPRTASDVFNAKDELNERFMPVPSRSGALSSRSGAWSRRTQRRTRPRAAHGGAYG